MTALIRIDQSWTPVGQGRPKPIRFCSRCGHPAEDPPGHPELRKRVCDRCGMGLVLNCPRDALPGGVDSLPPPKGIKDNGCGAKKADRTLGAPVMTDVVL